ncbi:hypothetical protein KW782_00690 [Candidatus Parcubacteria bacterium]|nr:hypothetical protein [Candidatus Parcubacteria bacterium]
MNEKEQYIALINEIIQKQSLILGPQIAVLKARGVSGITVTDEGKVTDISVDPAEALQQLIDHYVELSGQIVRNAMDSVFAKYPSINLKK